MDSTGGATHVDPITLRPAIAPYVIIVDAIFQRQIQAGLTAGAVK